MLVVAGKADWMIELVDIVREMLTTVCVLTVGIGARRVAFIRRVAGGELVAAVTVTI